MSFRDLFSRKSKPDAVPSEAKVICDTSELKEFVSRWMQSGGWEFENFADFIELIGIKTPVKLVEYDKENRSFKCITSVNTEICISVFFGDWLEDYPEIHVTEGEETRGYITNINIQKEEVVPKVTFRYRTIKRNGKELKSYYCEYFCHRTLKLDDYHILKVDIDEPDKYNDKDEILVLRNCAAIEEYLLSLNNSLNAPEVYEKVMGFLGFSADDISKCDLILISYIESDDQEERVRSKILLAKGELQEYAILEEGETYHVFKDGKWMFTNAVQIGTYN